MKEIHKDYIESKKEYERLHCELSLLVDKTLAEIQWFLDVRHKPLTSTLRFSHISNNKVVCKQAGGNDMDVFIFPVEIMYNDEALDTFVEEIKVSLEETHRLMYSNTGYLVKYHWVGGGL